LKLLKPETGEQILQKVTKKDFEQEATEITEGRYFIGRAD
jgi:hypothetical protein